MNGAPGAIAAQATPPGQGAIGIIRISGRETLPILQKIFRKGAAVAAPGVLDDQQDPAPITAGSRGLSSLAGPGQSPDKIILASTTLPCPFTPRRLYYGHIQPDAAQPPLDEVLTVYFPAPQSFSGEDAAEIHCHGSQAVLGAVLNAVLEAGARLAEPGEFTKRAFLNGRLDLAQAEAVAELIAAPTIEGAQLARQKLDGALSRAVEELRADLDRLRALTCLAIDFPDEASEGLSPLEEAGGDEALARALAALERLLNAHARAAILREGALAVLAGRVNVGKSSLLNALLGRERAIVSAEAGTTRDFIEEPLNIGGLPLRLTDTAGLRAQAEGPEAEGVRRTRALCAQADLILLVLEAGQPALDPAEEELLALYGPASAKPKLLPVLNKIDLGAVAPLPLPLAPLRLSAKEGRGLEDLAAALRERLLAPAGLESHTPAPNLRQARELSEAKAELERFAQGKATGLPADLLSLHLDAAAEHLARITGYSSADDILGAVFKNFCIGK